MVPQIIPGHITALYVFACINLMALFHITLVEADIRVLNSYNQTKAQYLDLPARFGPEFPEEGLYGRVQYSPLYNGCRPMPIPPISEPDPFIGWIALLQRNGCNFDVKVLNAQNAGYIAVIVYNNDSDNLVPMGGGKEADSVIIPSCFISAQDGLQLQEFGLDPSWWVIIDNRVPFNYNLYLLPFAIVVGICFVLMLVFMIAKCVRDLRRSRRARLSREHLKKLPTKKFKKGDPYDMCAICLDEYEEGDKLRILPCSHAYHMKCVDPWLTKNKRNCPVCKRKVIPGDEEDSDSDMDSDDEHDAPSETTPLLTTQTAEQLVATNTAFQTSGGAVSDANSVHPEDIPSEDSDQDEQEPPTTSTSVVHVHTPTSTTAMAGARGGGYGSLGRSPSHHQHPDDNPEYRGAVGGVGIYISGDEDEDEGLGAPHDSELRGILSSEPDEAEAEVEAEREKGLRVKIISLLKSRRQNRRSRRRDSHEEA